MNRYSIPCTEAQTRKALELGAPIIQYKNAFVSIEVPHFTESSLDGKENLVSIIPTAEQMINWLEEHGMNFSLAYNPFDEVKVIVTKSGMFDEIANIKWNKSKKEATLAAIDAALEYLEKHKQ